MRQILPQATGIAALYNPTYPPGRGALEKTKRVVDSLHFAFDVVEVHSAQDLEPAFERMSRWRADAVMVMNHGMFRRTAARLASLALGHRLPLFSLYAEVGEAGALVSWVPNFTSWSDRAAVYVDRILKGADPATLPVEESVASLYMLNLRTAKTLGIAIPESVMRSASRVIE